MASQRTAERWRYSGIAHSPPTSAQLPSQLTLCGRPRLGSGEMVATSGRQRLTCDLCAEMVAKSPHLFAAGIAHAAR